MGRSFKKYGGLIASNFIKFPFRDGLCLCRLGAQYPRCRAIASTLEGFWGHAPPRKISRSQRLILISFMPFYECVQSLVASPFPRATRRVARPRRQRRLARRGSRCTDYMTKITNETGVATPHAAGHLFSSGISGDPRILPAYGVLTRAKRAIKWGVWVFSLRKSLDFKRSEIVSGAIWK